MSFPPSNPDGRRIDRIASADVRAGLHHVQNPDVLRTGCVNLIGLDAIRDQLGERWPAKRARIWEHIERDFERRLTPHDMFFRLDEVTYLVAMPSCTQFMAQAACLSILQEVLTFFLGESHMRDVRVRAVSQIDGDEIVSEALDPAKIIEAAAKAAAAGPLTDHAHPAEDWKPPLAGRIQNHRLETESRRTAEVMMGVAGVWNLRRGLITSFVLERAVNPVLTNSVDIMKLDCAVMGYAAELLTEHRQRGGRLTLHVPLSYSSAATLHTREKVIGMAAAVRDLLRTTVLIELVDLDPGVPPSRLIEVVALLKPFCMGVLARVRPTRAALAAVKGCGLQGLVLDGHGLGRSAAETTTIMRAFVEAAHGEAQNLLVHGLSAKPMIDAAAAAGMTHASIRPALHFETAIDAA